MRVIISRALGVFGTLVVVIAVCGLSSVYGYFTGNDAFGAVFLMATLFFSLFTALLLGAVLKNRTP